MATRYWVGGSGSWTSTNTANWSASSGGASGASVPTATDDVVFDSNSDSGTSFTVTIASSTVYCLAFTATAIDQALSVALNGNTLQVRGNWTIPSSNFSINNTVAGFLNFNPSASNTTITSAGYTYPCYVVFTGASSILVDSFTTLGVLSIFSAPVTASANVTAAQVNITGSSFVSMGSGLWLITGAAALAPSWSSGSSSTTINRQTANITITDTYSFGTCNFTSAAAQSFNKVTFTDPSTPIVFQGTTRTFVELASTRTGAYSITFPGGSLNTFTKWSVNGSAGNLVTLQSSNTTAYQLIKGTLEDTGGPSSIVMNYMSISRASATTGVVPALNTWYATNSTDGGNNSNITFNAVSTGFLRLLG